MTKARKDANPELLDRFGIADTSDPTVKGLSFTGVSGRTSTFMVGPAGLAEVLTDLNGLLVYWAEFPEAVRKEVSGPAKALPASRVELAPGREPTEVALTIHAGPMQFVYLLPVQGFVPEALKMLKTIGPLSDRPVQ